LQGCLYDLSYGIGTVLSFPSPSGRDLPNAPNSVLPSTPTPKRYSAPVDLEFQVFRFEFFDALFDQGALVESLNQTASITRLQLDSHFPFLEKLS